MLYRATETAELPGDRTGWYVVGPDVHYRAASSQEAEAAAGALNAAWGRGRRAGVGVVEEMDGDLIDVLIPLIRAHEAVRDGTGEEAVWLREAGDMLRYAIDNGVGGAS